MPRRYRTLEHHIRTGTPLTLRQSGRAQVITRTVEMRLGARQFATAISNAIIIIGGLADPVANLARGLTIWSMLVLGAGFASLALIRAYMAGLVGEQLLFTGVFTTLLVAALIGLRTTTAARRTAITVQRLQIPEWLLEEV